MIEAALIEQCADPGLQPAIVQQFIAEAGSGDPLNVTVRAGSKTFLVPKPKSPDEAVRLVRDHIGKAVVRVGITQYPAGLGATQKLEITADVFDACNNIRLGTALFGRVHRVVAEWYGAPVDEVFEDAIEAYRTGYFEGSYVFTADDPGKDVELANPDAQAAADEATEAEADRHDANPNDELQQRLWAQDPNKANISIDLSGIGDFNKE